MPGTYNGGVKARDTNQKRYGADFYKRIGSIGGLKGTTGGFAAKIVCEDTTCTYSKPNHLVRQCAGYRGGLASRRTRKNCLHADCDKGAWKNGYCHDHFIEVYREEHHE